jgi:hypothetical protein
MRALCWNGTNDLRVERLPDPGIVNPKDAIIRSGSPRSAAPTSTCSTASCPP